VLPGKAELREHFKRGLAMVPNLRFEFEEIFTCPGGYTVLYRRENENRVIDAVVLDNQGRAVQVRALYGRPQG
jgi:hypothetical protein